MCVDAIHVLICLLVGWNGIKSNRVRTVQPYPEAILRRVLLSELIPVNHTYQDEAHSGLQFIESHRGTHNALVSMAPRGMQNKTRFPFGLVPVGQDPTGLTPCILDTTRKFAGARRNQEWQHQTLQRNRGSCVFQRDGSTNLKLISNSSNGAVRNEVCSDPWTNGALLQISLPLNSLERFERSAYATSTDQNQGTRENGCIQGGPSGKLVIPIAICIAFTCWSGIGLWMWTLFNVDEERRILRATLIWLGIGSFCGGWLSPLVFLVFGLPPGWPPCYPYYEGKINGGSENQPSYMAHQEAILHPSFDWGVALVAASAARETCREISCGLQQFAYAPRVIGDPSGHRGRNAKRFVNPAEVVEREPAGQRCPVVLPLLTEGVGQSCKSSRTHTDREILAFDMRRANAFGVGLPHDWDYLHGLHFCGAVASFPGNRGAVDLDAHGEVRAILKRVRDCGAIRGKSVSRDLKLAASGESLALDENIRRGLIALTEREVENELRVPLDSDKAVGVTVVRVVFRPDALLFFLNERPQFVTLNVLDGNVADFLPHDPFALLASEHQEFQDGRVVNLGQPLDTRNGVAFEQHPQNHFSLLDWQVHAVQRLFLRLGERLVALAALVAGKPVAMFAELAALGTAVMAGHPTLELSSSRMHNGVGPTIHPLGFGLRLNPVGSSNYLPGFVFPPQSPWDRKLLLFLEARNELVQRTLFGLHSLKTRIASICDSLQNRVDRGQRIGLLAEIVTRTYQTIPNSNRRPFYFTIPLQELADTIGQSLFRVANHPFRARLFARFAVFRLKQFDRSLNRLKLALDFGTLSQQRFKLGLCTFERIHT
jgi:hypothetical protein